MVMNYKYAQRYRDPPLKFIRTGTSTNLKQKIGDYKYLKLLL